MTVSRMRVLIWVLICATFCLVPTPFLFSDQNRVIDNFLRGENVPDEPIFKAKALINNEKKINGKYIQITKYGDVVDVLSNSLRGDNSLWIIRTKDGYILTEYSSNLKVIIDTLDKGSEHSIYFSPQKNKYTNTTIYSPTQTVSPHLTPFVIQSDKGETPMFLRLEYLGDKWLFAEKVQFLTDGKPSIIFQVQFERKVIKNIINNRPQNQEIGVVQVSDQKLLENIYKSKHAVFKVSGSGGSIEYLINDTAKDFIRYGLQLISDLKK